jgi:hypothetical protein
MVVLRSMHCPKAATWVGRNMAHPLDSGLPKPDYVWRYAHESPLLALVSNRLYLVRLKYFVQKDFWPVTGKAHIMYGQGLSSGWCPVFGP